MKISKILFLFVLVVFVFVMAVSTVNAASSEKVTFYLLNSYLRGSS